jgi:pyruvate/2-oxoglutarate/acetoin dehydrogenase E1 component
MAQLTYRDALRQALADAMRADPDIFLIGEEVGRYGGAYGVTQGLIGEFGPDRVIDTPISEPAIVGTAVGAAMAGMRPVAELMYVDFIGMTMDQLCNQAAKTRYMFGGQIGVPMVLRTQGGTGRSAGAQHSQSLEAHVMHTPGLRLAMPGTVHDAYHLLRQALCQPDPVVFIEHKALYALAEEVDLATPPPDFDTVARAVETTGRAMVVSEAPLTAGVAAELAARISEECFDFLENPVLRVAGEDIPIPVAAELERAAVPGPDLIAEMALRLLR